MTEPLKIKKYGWVKSFYDRRDRRFSAPIFFDLPKSVDLRPMMPEVWNQGMLGSCVSHSCAALAEYLLKKENQPKVFTPSRLFNYYNARVFENTTKFDAGCMLRTGMKVMASMGNPEENLWWYNIIKFKVKPNKKVYKDATRHKIINYQSIERNMNQLKGILAMGFPFVFGFSVYETFEGPEIAQTGIMKMPGQGERVIGGHAVTCVGFSDEKQAFLIRNSWAAGWGEAGHFWMPFEFMTSNDTDDFWTATDIAN